MPLVPRFPCPAVRVMLLRLVIEQPFQREAATTRMGGGKRSASHLGDGGAAAPVKRNRKRGCRELRERERELSVSVSCTTKGKNPPKDLE